MGRVVPTNQISFVVIVIAICNFSAGTAINFIYRSLHVSCATISLVWLWLHKEWVGYEKGLSSTPKILYAGEQLLTVNVEVLMPCKRKTKGFVPRPKIICRHHLCFLTHFTKKRTPVRFKPRTLISRNPPPPPLYLMSHFHLSFLAFLSSCHGRKLHVVLICGRVHKLYAYNYCGLYNLRQKKTNISSFCLTLYSSISLYCHRTLLRTSF